MNPIHVIDLAVLLPAFIIAGDLTLKGQAARQFFVGPLLTFSVLMGASIVAAKAPELVEQPGVAPLAVIFRYGAPRAIASQWATRSGAIRVRHTRLACWDAVVPHRARRS